MKITLTIKLNYGDQKTMNKQDFFHYHQKFTKKILDISQKKNTDYTGETTDPFANFSAVERNGLTSTEVGFMVRMTDKMQRLTSYVQNGKLLVEDEKVEDTLMDLANYCILFSAYLESQKEDTQIDLNLEGPVTATDVLASRDGPFWEGKR